MPLVRESNSRHRPFRNNPLALASTETAPSGPSWWTMTIAIPCLRGLTQTPSDSSTRRLISNAGGCLEQFG